MSTEAPLDLKKTVNLPKTAFAQKANLAQSEPARLKKWTEMGLYEMIQRTRSGRDKFVLHDGPPYANADIDLGAALKCRHAWLDRPSLVMVGEHVTLGESERYPTACERCVAALSEIEREETAA